MPIPTPNQGEDKNEYVGRCVEFLENEGRPHDQSVAICLNKWEKTMGESQILERIDILLNEEEGNVEFYSHAQSKPSDTLKIKDVPSLLRAIGQGVKKISLESEGDRKALNKALKSGKKIYVAFNPFHEQVSNMKQLLWFTDKKKFVKTYGDLAMEV